MSDLHLAHPALLHLAWPWLALVALLVALERRRGRSIEQLVGPSLRARLVAMPAAWRRTARTLLLGLAGLAMIAALARPQWGLRHVATPRVGAEIMIALDVSRSMLADDAKPSRLERAKADLADLLSYLENDHVGLIAFAGRASVISPMTPDKSFLRLVLDEVGPQSAGRGGTKLAAPIRAAIAGMGEAGPAQRALILITDGEDHDSFALDAAKDAAAAGIKIIAIGFGDEAGSEISITDPKTGARTLLRDAEGRPVVSRLDGELLRAIALATDGAYVPAGTGVLDLASIYDRHIAGLTRGQLDERGRTIRDELYPWCVLAALAALVASAAVAAGGAGAAGARRGAARRRAAGLLAAALLPAAAVTPAARAQAATPSSSDALLPSADAKDANDASDASAADEGGGSEADAGRAPSAGATPADAPTPRERYNRAVALLADGDFAAAEPLLREARRDATDDLELRFAATYDLGIAAAARAEAAEPSAPAQALDALHEAADWFREASAQRPDDEDARHNLEVALRKALILADWIEKQSDRGLESELDALLAAQRDRTEAAAQLLEAAAQETRGDASAPSDALRQAARDAATAQRTLLADASALGERIARERDAIAARTDEERTPDDAVRSAQLDAVLRPLDASVERMGQARQQLRLARPERAYRRSAAALAELSRARDVLRGPVEQLDVLRGEVASLAQQTAALGAKESGARLPGSDEPVELPAFLTRESVAERAASASERMRELASRFAIARERADAERERGASGDDGGDAPNAAASPSASPEADAEAEALATMAAAAPDVDEAARALETTPALVEAGRHAEALDATARAAAAIGAARERFFRLRELVEAAYADERRIASAARADDAELARARDELADTLRDLQAHNVERAARIAAEVEREDAALDAAAERAAAQAAAPDDDAHGGGAGPGDAAADAPSPEQIDAERARLAAARELAAQARAAMDLAAQALAASPPTWPAAGEHATRAADDLSRLRALFFSIAEHVREALRAQQALADRTLDAVALAADDGARDTAASAATAGADDATSAATADADDAAGAATADAKAPPGAAARGEAAPGGAPRSDATRERAGALAAAQTALAERAGEIGDALASQAEQARERAAAGAPATPASPPAPGTDSEAEPDPSTLDEPTRLRLAGERVVAAQLAMRESAAVLGDDAQPLAPARAPQAAAMDALERALALLAPPPPPPGAQQQQQPDRQPERGEGAGPDEPQPSAPQPGGGDENDRARENREPAGRDPAQLLQGVRDREAQRRRDRARGPTRDAPVDKDW